jgi:peptidoglycan/xylan/chitin deacetylase (PgdA/CDA1 family)
MKLRKQASYVLNFLEGSLGLAHGSLEAGAVPGDLVDELSAVMGGSSPNESASPSLEAKIMAMLEEVEKSSIEEDGFFVRKARWPNAAPFAVCLTHDVDNIERPMEHIMKVRDRFSEEDFEKAKEGLLSLYDNMELIGKKEKEKRFKSSFYLMSANYPLDKVKKAARALHSKGWEIGLHGDFGTHDSAQEMRKAVRRLADGVGIRPRGVREHYLRFDFGTSWRIMEGAGFDYDTTVGNSDRLGFRLGLATPFHPPDAEWRPMRILELPLSLMDTTLWGYLKKSEEDGLEDVMRLMSEVEKVEGLFTLLWHQEAVRMKGGRVYWRILEELHRRKELFVGTGAEVARWWLEREVPLKVAKGARSGRLITLGSRPPRGLKLILKTKEGTKVKVTSGSARKRGGESLVSPSGPGFKLEVAGGA